MSKPSACKLTINYGIILGKLIYRTQYIDLSNLPQAEVYVLIMLILLRNYTIVFGLRGLKVHKLVVLLSQEESGSQLIMCSFR